MDEVLPLVAKTAESASPFRAIPLCVVAPDDPGLPRVREIAGVIGVDQASKMTVNLVAGINEMVMLMIGRAREWEVGGVEPDEEYPGKVMDAVHPAGESDSASWRVLVTSEAELATSDAVYVDVLTGLDQLIAAAKQLTASAPEADPEPTALGPAALVSALAQAVPGALSLLSAHRTLSTAAVTVTDLAAAARTAGDLAKRDEPGIVVHDDFRLLPGGTVHKKLTAVNKQRQELVAAKVEQESKRSLATAELTRARDTIADLTKRLEDTSDTDKPGLQAQLEDQRKAVAAAETNVNDAAVRIGLIDAVTPMAPTGSTDAESTRARGLKAS